MRFAYQGHQHRSVLGLATSSQIGRNTAAGALQECVVGLDAWFKLNSCMPRSCSCSFTVRLPRSFAI